MEQVHRAGERTGDNPDTRAHMLRGGEGLEMSKRVKFGVTLVKCSVTSERWREWSGALRCPARSGTTRGARALGVWPTSHRTPASCRRPAAGWRNDLPGMHPRRPRASPFWDLQERKCSCRSIARCRRCRAPIACRIRTPRSPRKANWLRWRCAHCIWLHYQVDDALNAVCRSAFRRSRSPQ